MSLVRGVALRLTLALVNTDGNDNHLAVVEIPRVREPDTVNEEAHVAYPPKLYHAAAALLRKLAPTDSRYVPIRLAQLLSCAAGVWTLTVLWRVLRGIEPRP